MDHAERALISSQGHFIADVDCGDAKEKKHQDPNSPGTGKAQSSLQTHQSFLLSFPQRRESGAWTFVKRQEVASSLWSPSRASDGSPGRRERQEPLAAPWVSIPTICSLSPNTFFVLGERARVRGRPLLIRENHASFRKAFREQRNARLATGQRTAPLPTSPPESPKDGRFGGRGEELVETLTQGGAKGSCPSLDLGYFLVPFQGVPRKQRPPAAALLEKRPISRLPLSRK